MALLNVDKLSVHFGDEGTPFRAVDRVSYSVNQGEVVGIVGESGSGNTTLLKSISSRLTPQSGEILYQNRSLYGMNEADRRRLLRTEWGVVHQHPLDGLRRQVSAGGNIGERLMATGARHYGDIRATLQKQGLPIGNNDLWLAAHARAEDWILVTNNTREFTRVPGLQVENWV